jgi:hypothetical protein
MKRVAITIIVVSLCGVAAFCGGRDERVERGDSHPEPTIPIERVIDLEPGGVVRIANTIGDLRIVGWDRNQVRVTGLIGEDVVAVEVTKDGTADAEVKVELPDVNNLANLSVAAELEIYVPSSSSVDVGSMQSDVAVGEITGEISVQTMAGNVDIRGGGSDSSVWASSMTGEITVSGPYVEVQAETVTGAITITGARGSVIASTMTGDTTLEGVELMFAELQTGIGSIRIDATVPDDAFVHASTAFGGTIEATIQPEFEGLVTLTGGMRAVDWSRFKPNAEVTTLMGDIDVVPGVPGLRGLSMILERVDPFSGRAIERSLVPGDRRVVIMTRSLFEFQVGDGDARIVLDSQGRVGARGSGDTDERAIILSTR